MPHGPSHCFIVVSGGGGVDGARGEDDGGAAAGGPGIIEIDPMNSLGFWYVAHHTLCAKNESFPTWFDWYQCLNKIAYVP